MPAASVGNDQVFVERGDRDLAEVDGVWVAAAKEAADEPGLDALKKKFHAGPGQDPRVLSRTVDSQGRRLLTLEKAFPLFLECVELLANFWTKNCQRVPNQDPQRWVHRFFGVPFRMGRLWSRRAERSLQGA